MDWWKKRKNKWLFEKELEKVRTTKTYKESKEIFILPRLDLTDNLKRFLGLFYGIMIYSSIYPAYNIVTILGFVLLYWVFKY